MNKIRFLVLATLLSVTVVALKHEDGQHVQAITNSTEYVKGLRDQQKRFQQSINKLDTNIQETVSGATSQTDIDKKISILQEGILNQQAMIYNSSTTLIPILVIKDQCVGLTDEDKARIIQRCDTAINRINSLQQKLDGMPEDLRIRELKLNAAHQLQYLTALKNVVINNCTTSVILSPTVYQSNLIAPNWVAGSKGLRGITNQYIQRSLNNANITNCPLSAPFYINGKCSNCPTGQVFDMSVSKCITCPTNTTFDQPTKTCKANPVVVPPTPPENNTTPTPTPPENNTTPTPTPPVNNTTPVNNTPPTPPTPPSPNATNTNFLGSTVGTKPTPTPTDVQCPATSPYFNKETNKCQSCNEGEYYYFDNNQCLKPNSNNPDTKQPTFGTPQPLTAPVKVPCPESHPFFFSGSCHICTNTSFYFNQQDGKCYQCKPGQILVNNTCTEPATLNITEAGKRDSYIGTLPTQTTPGVKICPAQTPYVSRQGVCMECPPQAKYYVVEEKVCASCPENTEYSTQQRTCVQIQPTGTNIEAIKDKNYIGTPPETQATQPCNASTPFYDALTKSCTDCTQDSQKPIFDFEKQTCGSCPQYWGYSAQQKKCVQPRNNLAGANGANNYIGEIADAGNASVCPAQKPYYSASAKECINCPPSTDPSLIYFDVTKGQCVTCQPGEVYDPATRKCGGCQNGDQYDTELNKCVSTNPPVAQTKPYIGNYTPTTSQNLCPEATPFYSTTQKKCIACPPADDSTKTIFDFNSGDCIACGAYNQTTHTCKNGFVSYISAPNWFAEHPFQKKEQALKKLQEGYQPCNRSTPFFNGFSCIQCNDPTPNFNFDTLKCQPCPSGTHYDPQTHHCLKDDVQYKTIVPNVTQRLIVDQPMDQVLSEYKTNPAQPCPIDKPFFNGKQCINCTKPYQYFHITELDCQYCLNNSTFVNNQCRLGGSGIAPNLESLIQNVFPTHDESYLGAHKRHSIM